MKTRHLATILMACGALAALAHSTGAARFQSNVVPPGAKPPGDGVQTAYVVEMEDLIATAEAIPRKPVRQDMRGFGPSWSGGEQLFWRTDGPGNPETKMLLTFTVPVSGVYNVELFFTKAPDAADYFVQLGTSDYHLVDAFAKEVQRYSTVLPQRNLTAGPNKLNIVVYRKHPLSTGYIVGLDRLDLKLLTPADTTPFLIPEAGGMMSRDTAKDAASMKAMLEALKDQREDQLQSLIDKLKPGESGRGLILVAASRAGAESRYTFAGPTLLVGQSGLSMSPAIYDAKVRAEWDPVARQADETISFKTGNKPGGQLSVRFSCSGDPFIASPSFVGPNCKQIQLAVDGDDQDTLRWQMALKDRPLTFRLANPATAQEMMAKSGNAPSNPPPPPPDPTPADPKVSTPVGRPVRAGTDFPLPTWRGRRVDLCLRWSADCGQPAADEFCRRNGFTRASSWKPDPSADETLVIGDNRPCSSPNCSGFAIITCAK